MTVAEKLRQLRGEISLREFSKKVGVSHSSISRIESGTFLPGLKVVRSLMKISGKSLEYWTK